MSRLITRTRAGSVLALLVLVATAGCAMPRGEIVPRAAAASAGSTEPATTGAPTASSTGAGRTTAGSSTADSTSGNSTTVTPRTKSAAAQQPTAATTSSSCAADCYQVGAAAYLPAGVAVEASGLAASSTRSDAWFTVDDGTHADGIVAVSGSGKLLATIGVDGMDAGNAEALAAGTCATGSKDRCLYIGDIGDNAAKRSDVVITRIAEPRLGTASKQQVSGDAWSYTYPDGPHDAEALVVAPDASLVIITKSAPNDAGKVPPHKIYRGTPGGGELQYVGSFTPPDPTVRLQSLLTGTVVTDADYSDGRLLLLTYDEVVEYTAPTADADPADFPSWPHRSLPHPTLIQTEGIAFAPTGCGYAVSSEAGPDGTRASLATVSCS